ncbi:UvrD-helicase domain-containing protein [Marinifilum sp. D714]|uniref:UvrD-helicase domain-containing protein n=1 Tax=Marinifilum sp. D714 TaxID=2937523 RepID=UPI0027C6F137|nr:UvrD-helicase domain-containing protein [Marinifilum sp. D714]MDQ2180469.1 UvrD-helicase domain-containing protein [Marinifilum sp. D714]
MIKVTDDDIKYAEQILLGKNKHFDEERVDFIKDFDTLDLQAVPGSGKTTALLAKLLILEKYLPIKDNGGVLVISHTNTAVDEIKERIGKYCPKLFSYPNFVGTIQSFVDVFLAIPCYMNQFKSKPYRIDNEIYDEQVEKFYANTPNRGLKGFLDKQIDGLKFLKSIRLTRDMKLKSYIDGKSETFKLKDPNKPTYKSLREFKIKLLSNGYLHFDDAYFLAEVYTNKIPNIKNIIQNRFQYVFVDEMQDMDTHQYQLLEDLFYDSGKSLSSIQRIGDINQAIFNENSNSLNIWTKRANIKYLKGSYRLNPNIASIVEKLALSPNDIEGRLLNIDIKPTILLFTDKNRSKVLEKYSELISQYQACNKISKDAKNTYTAIAWRKEHDDLDKIGLKDYWGEYNSEPIKTKIDYKCLEDYLLNYDKENRTFESIRKNILNSFLRILRIENIVDENQKYFTKRKLFNYIKAFGAKEYEDFKLNLYNWSFGIIKNDNDVINKIRIYIPSLLGIFGKSIILSNGFISNNASTNIIKKQTTKVANKFQYNGFQIDVGTVHSVKGQTHTATLYLETFFYKYESEYLKEIFLNKSINSKSSRIIKAMKTSYVGFSRPTHLLCVAIYEDRFNKHLSQIDRSTWDIVNV